MTTYYKIRNVIMNFIEPIWYRFVGYKLHIIKTELTPSAWYDADTRILYAVMEIVKWYVENDMRIISKEEFEEEIERMKRDENAEYLKLHIEAWTDQYNRDQEIIGIWKWWVNYNNRQEEVRLALRTWSNYIESCGDEDDDSLALFFRKDKLTPEQNKEIDRLRDIHNNLEEKLQEEEQVMLNKAIELRGGMWS